MQYMGVAAGEWCIVYVRGGSRAYRPHIALLSRPSPRIRTAYSTHSGPLEGGRGRAVSSLRKWASLHSGDQTNALWPETYVPFGNPCRNLLAPRAVPLAIARARRIQRVA